MYRNLYIHVPFCRRKCDYCAFYSTPDTALWENYLQKLFRDLENAGLKNLHTVYFGGGTPTFPEESRLAALLEGVLSRIATVPDAEITIEANPETLTAGKASILGHMVNRVSMGVQSFDIAKRAVLGREPATADDVPRALDLLRNAGLENIGFDLIYGVPGESRSAWKKDMQTAASYGVTHISAYALIPEPGTAYVRKHGEDTDDDDLWDFTGEVLRGLRYPRYEVSNYAQEKYEAKHNQNVWHGETYLGLGPAACSFDGTDRRTEIAGLEKWLAGEQPEIDRIDPEQRRREVFMMGLRTVRGWDQKEFDWSFLTAELADLQEDGLIELTPDTCRPTLRGLTYWNDVAERILK